MRFRLGTAPRQTTRVVPGACLRRALYRLRALGTLPPAGGRTDLSGAGSGQYEARSMWADAVAATTIAAASTAMAASAPFL
jgi:hypothetical protein